MLTSEDIKKLKKELANREDLIRLEKKIDNKADKEDLANLLTLEEFSQFKREQKQEFSELREVLQGLTISIDKLVKTVENIYQEHLMIIAKVDRHEKWLIQVAKKLDIKLDY